MAAGSMGTEERHTGRKTMAHQACAALAVVSLLLCVASPCASSPALLVVPLLGLTSIALGIYVRAWWGCIAGILEIISPAVLIYLTYYVLALGA